MKDYLLICLIINEALGAYLNEKGLKTMNGKKEILEKIE